MFNQQVAVLNAGSARADSGNNEAGGNGSTNAAAVAQGAGAGDGGPDPETLLAPSATSGASPVSIASNNGEASNSSDGTARITTGDADAVGNRSETDITQSASGQILGSGGVGVLAQGAVVVNEGEAWADTGHNSAAGNGSSNDAAVGQDAVGRRGLGRVRRRELRSGRQRVRRHGPHRDRRRIGGRQRCRDQRDPERRDHRRIGLDQ